MIPGSGVLCIQGHRADTASCPAARSAHFDMKRGCATFLFWTIKVDRRKDECPQSTS